MKFLTVYQPYSSLIEYGLKTVVTRPRPTAYRGLLAIHSAKKDTDGSMFSPEHKAAWDALSELIGGDAPTRGAVVAVCELLDVVPADPKEWNGRILNPWTGYSKMGDGTGADLRWSDGHRRVAFDWEQQAPFDDFRVNRHALLLTGVRRLPEPVPMTGGQGVRNVSADVEARIVEQLETT